MTLHLLTHCVYFRALQEAQDIFGVDFDYEDFNQEGEEYEDDEEEEYEDEEGIRKTRKKTGVVVKKKSQRKTIYDVYEPSELERGHFTDFDEKVQLPSFLCGGFVSNFCTTIFLTDS